MTEMEKVRVEDAVGMVLCHDITEIVPGKFKGRAFAKGHIIEEKDIEKLLDLGKRHIYVWDLSKGYVHENDAALRMVQAVAGDNITFSEVKEGKIELIADCDGLFLVDVDRLRAVNGLGEIVIATRSSGFVVKKGDKLCGTRVIPLVIDKEKRERARQAAGQEPLLQLLPLQPKTYGVVTTGNEVFYGRITDKFTPVLEEKLQEYGCRMAAHQVLGDDPQAITAAIQKMLDDGCQMVFCTGGMSVDPDDRTPLAIRNTGARVVSYGAPVLPGAMFLVAYTEDGRPVCGLPGCIMYAKRTIFDLVLPRLLAGVPVTEEWLAGLGNGGLCLNCPECHFPNCGFGKGV